MSENSSSASKSSIMPGEKFKSSTISENSKSGELGDMPVSVSDASSAAASSSAQNKVTESYGSKSGDGISAKSAMPAGKPSSSFINTSAVK